MHDADAETLSRETKIIDRWRVGPPNPLLTHLEPHLPDAGLAVDIGCGIGRASELFLDRGLDVLAIDANPRYIAVLRGSISREAGLRAVCTKVESYDLPSCDVVFAGYSLFFVPPHEFLGVWSGIVEALKPGGLLAAQMLGDRDGWQDAHLTRLSRDELHGALSGLQVLHYEEVEEEGETLLGTAKRWHVHHFVARKPPQSQRLHPE